MPSHWREIVITPITRSTDTRSDVFSFGSVLGVAVPESGAALTQARIAHEVRRASFWVPTLLIALLVAKVFWLAKHSRDASWAPEVAIPQITPLADRGSLPAATRFPSEPRNRFPLIRRTSREFRSARIALTMKPERTHHET